MNPHQKKIAEAINKATLHKVNAYNNADYEGFVDKEILIEEVIKIYEEEDKCRYCKGKYLPYPIETEHLSCRACNRKIGTNFNKTQFVEACGLNVPEEQSSSKDLKTARGEE